MLWIPVFEFECSITFAIFFDHISKFILVLVCPHVCFLFGAISTAVLSRPRLQTLYGSQMCLQISALSV